MSPYTVLVLCISALLIQSVMSGKSSYGLNSGNYGLNSGNYGLNSGNYGASSCGSYGGEGTGQVSAAGNIDACGQTCVKGAVPVLGAVCFEGCAPACGTVSICGKCGCGCN